MSIFHLRKSGQGILITACLVLLFLGGFVGDAYAQASLFIVPASGTYKVGEAFSVLVNVDSGGHSINAGSAQINFDNQRFEVTQVGYTRSVFTLWTEEPKFSNAAGTLKFSGGLPNPGFIGSSGSVIRINFRTKATGEAKIAFLSGSVLANDGKGTNILEDLKGAKFVINAAADSIKPISPVTPITTKDETAQRPIEAPTITDIPNTIEAGSALTVRGLGYPNGKVIISTQKGSDEAIAREIFANIDGRFTYTYAESLSEGFYRVWARNLAPDGRLSHPSESLLVEVTKPLFFRLGTYAINFANIIVTLLALVLFAVILVAWMWLKLRRWQTQQGVEISEAEKSLHHGFDKLKDGLNAYVRYLSDAKSVKDVAYRERETAAELKEALDDIEGEIQKEIEDVKKPLRKPRL